MNLIGFYMIVPPSLATLATGLIQSLGTEWGLLRHRWVLTKFTLTIGSLTPKLPQELFIVIGVKRINYSSLPTMSRRKVT